MGKQKVREGGMGPGIQLLSVGEGQLFKNPSHRPSLDGLSEFPSPST